MTEVSDYAEEKVSTVETIAAPWGREVTLQAVDHQNGLKMMRVRIREGRARFTILDIDPRTARAWGQAMLDWAKEAE